jgi:hypothetical protein
MFSYASISVFKDIVQPKKRGVKRGTIQFVLTFYIMYFFRTFQKSTVPYKVHNMGLRYIKDGSIQQDEIYLNTNSATRLTGTK